MKCLALENASHSGQFNKNSNTLSPNLMPNRSPQPSHPIPIKVNSSSHPHSAITLLNQPHPLPAQVTPVTSPPTSRVECTHTHRPKPLQSALICVICQVAIRGRYGACLVCGHVAHAKCHRGWFCPDVSDVSDSDSSQGESNAGRGERECPAGCGCRCMDYAADGFGFEVPPPTPPPPPPLSRLVSKPSFGLGSKRISLSSLAAAVIPNSDDAGRGGSGVNLVGAYGAFPEDLGKEFLDDEILEDDEEYSEDGEAAGNEGEAGDAELAIRSRYLARLYDVPRESPHVSEYSGL